MAEKPETWLAKDPATPLQAVGLAGHTLTPDELVIEVEACSLWHENLGFVFGAIHNRPASQTMPKPRIEGHVIEAGEDALYFVDRLVAMRGVLPCGQHDQCWLGGAVSCPRKAGPNSDDLGPHHVVVRASEVSILGERMLRVSMVGLDPFKAG